MIANEMAGIEAFVHTAELLSFRGAAERLGVSPAAISKAVSKLEERLGVQLLERTSRKVSLTGEGCDLLRHSRVALDALQAGRDAVQRFSRVPQGTLRVSLPFILGRTITGALPRLAARHPRLSFDLHLTDRFVRLHEENIDVAVRIGALPDSELVARRLSTPRWVTVASPAYLARRGSPRTPADLTEHDCLKFTAPNGALVEWQFAASAGGEGRVIQLPTRHRINQGQQLIEAARAGLGVVQAFDFLVGELVASGELIELLAHQAAMGPPIHALCRPRRQRTPKIRVFFEMLTEAFRA